MREDSRHEVVGNRWEGNGWEGRQVFMIEGNSGLKRNNRSEERRKGIYNFSPYIFYQNEQLMKDCGLIPYMFLKQLGYRAVIITAKREEYTYLEKMPGLELVIPETPTDLSQWIESCCDYISGHYQEMDVMFCFGAYSSHIPMVRLFKQLKPDGKVILKLDANLIWEDRIPFQEADYREFLERCDVITVESKKLKRYLSRKWPYKIEYLPNGSVDTNSRIRTEYEDKENTILTVGRIGNQQKANEILMEAFRLAAPSIPGWKLKLIGSIEDNFQPYIQSFLLRNPELKDRMIFAGKIVDKVQLEEEYRKAKIFALTSRLEGAPNVLAEAARNGCYILCSNIDAVEEATDCGRCGRSFEIDDYRALSKIMIEVCNDEKCLKTGCYDIQEYHDRFFQYEKHVYKLEQLLYLPTGDE